MNSEEIVVEEVVSYFSRPRFERISVKREDEIQFGSRIGYADVALLDDKAHRVAIIECKKVGYEGNGIEQLKSYLSATSTVLGGFANSTDPDDWYFCENLGANRFREITRSRFEARVLKLGIFGTLTHYLKRIFTRRKPIPPVESEERIITQSAPYYTPFSYTTGGFPPVQNENTEPSLNDKPYYAEENGFNWAGYQRGNNNCIELHVTRIIYNEELRFLPDRSAAQDEINAKSDQIAKLESQKNILETEREKYKREVEDKNKELVVLEIKAEGPTEAELENPSINTEPNKNNSRKRSWIDCLIWMFPVLVGAYIFIFYTSVCGKAFFLNEGKLREQIVQGEYVGIQDIVDPNAIFNALSSPPNLFVMFFPLIIFAFAKWVECLLDRVVDCWNEFRRRAYWFLGGLMLTIALVFVFDMIVALRISKQIHDAKIFTGQVEGDWPINPLNPLDYDLDILTVIFCGFVSALLYSGVWYFAARKWKTIGVVAPDRTQSKVQQHRIDNENIERKARIAGLKTEIENHETFVNRCDDEFNHLGHQLKEEHETIRALKESLKTPLINRSELLKRVNQFLNGWCRFLAQCGAPRP